MSDTGLLLLRLGIAVVSVAHGAHTLFGMFGGAGTGLGPGGLSQAAEQFSAMGLPGFALAVLAGLTQVLGGLLLAVGYFTRAAAVAVAALTAALAWKAQLPWGFFLNWIVEPGRGQGIEFSFLLFAGLVCLALTGAGSWSLDGRRVRRNTYAAAGRARLRRT